LGELQKRLKVCLDSISEDWEIIYVEDCGNDGAWEILKSFTEKDNRIKALQLSRNFGQHIAITAGIDEAQGEWNIVMDCDLQDPPEEIPKLYQKAQEGFDIVLAER
jgi:glycosyltransferase involved in cell wall biosynthesis